MQNVSEAWKLNQTQNFVSEAFVEVNLTVADPNAMDDATTNANGEEYFSHAAYLTSVIAKNPQKYATLEHNIWSLDGTCVVLPNSGYGEQGYIGNTLCNSSGEFSITPTITISFSEVFTDLVQGVTITWGEAYNEFARDFTITVSNGSTQIAQQSVVGNTDLTSVVEFDIQNYDSIVIEVTKWSLPYRRARAKEITIGIIKTFDKKDLMDYVHSNTVDPLSAVAPKNEIKFSVKNLNGEYNPDNPQSVSKYLLERQLITARYGYMLNGEIEWIKAGTFFLSEWEMPQNGITATFTARDALEYMTDIYSGTTTGTLYQIATEAFTQANLPLMSDGSNRWTIDASLETIYAPQNVDLEESTTVMEVLQYCANAACCVFYQDRNGILHIEPLGSMETDYEISRFNSYQNSELTLSKQLKGVNVNNGQYELNVGTVGEVQPINNPLISDAQAPIVATWARDYLMNRQTLNGDFRADPRLDPIDRITNTNQFSESTVLVTEVTLNFNGMFKGNYAGRRGA